MSKDGKNSWWATLPGMLTGVAAVLSALTALIVAVDQLELFSPAPETKPEAAAEARVPPPLAGNTFKVDGNDGIIVRQVAIDSDKVEIVLQVAPTITWWKSLKIYDRQGRMISQLETQDADKGPKSSGPLAAGNFDPRIEIEFLKAKFAGAETGVGRVPFPRADLRGYRTTFYWESD